MKLLIVSESTSPHRCKVTQKEGLKSEAMHSPEMISVSRLSNRSICINRNNEKWAHLDHNESPVLSTTEMDKKSRSVHFCKSVYVRRTRPLDRYTNEEIQACWYQSKEMEEIQSKCLDDIEAAASNEYADGTTTTTTTTKSSICLRGLESYDRSAPSRKRNLRAKAANCVFRAQAKGGNDATIADHYAAITTAPQQWAIARGMQDQIEAISCDKGNS